MSKNWTVNDLKNELTNNSSTKHLKGWVIKQETVFRHERYFMPTEKGSTTAVLVDQDREANIRNVNLKIFVNSSKKDRQHEAMRKLSLSSPLRPQLNSLFDSAMQTDSKAWDLSTSAKDLPKRITCDEKLLTNFDSVLDDLTDTLLKSAEQTRPTSFNSAELFLSTHEFSLEISNGFSHKWTQSRAYAEGAFSAQKGRHSDEFYSYRWAVKPGELRIEGLFDEIAQNANYVIQAKKPKTGSYPVIVGSDVLNGLFREFTAQLSSVNSYHKLPFLPPSSAFVDGARGDLISLSIDPELEFGADTTAVSDLGTVQKKIVLVESNIVKATSTDKQYADYLGIPVSTTRGDIVVAPGKTNYDGLTKAGPRVMEILQFSALFIDSNTCTFGSEIRLARVFDNERGTIEYVKGGSISGSLQNNFKNLILSNSLKREAAFSSNSQQGYGYKGPAHALLSDVSVVG